MLGEALIDTAPQAYLSMSPRQPVQRVDIRMGKNGNSGLLQKRRCHAVSSMFDARKRAVIDRNRPTGRAAIDEKRIGAAVFLRECQRFPRPGDEFRRRPFEPQPST